MIYRNVLLNGMTLVEEFLPFTEIFPTGTDGWVLQWVRQYTVIYMFPSVRTFFHSIHVIYISVSLSPYLLVCLIFVFLSVKVGQLSLSLSSFPSRHPMCWTISTKENQCICLVFCICFCYRSIRPSFILRTSACISSLIHRV